MTLKKKRINKLSCLNWIAKGQKVIIALYDAVRFKEMLKSENTEIKGVKSNAFLIVADRVICYTLSTE